ncbi:hypothetical protein PLIP_a3835 [Pseudoalteromonas lipolytica LMEB 39]|nr:hypothetical protein [Pseudoalteromonas lipolytica LMEB 39]
MLRDGRIRTLVQPDLVSGKLNGGLKAAKYRKVVVGQA